MTPVNWEEETYVENSLRLESEDLVPDPGDYTSHDPKISVLVTAWRIRSLGSLSLLELIARYVKNTCDPFIKNSVQMLTP